MKCGEDFVTASQFEILRCVLETTTQLAIRVTWLAGEDFGYFAGIPQCGQ
jgi:hypothetical protein